MNEAERKLPMNLRVTHTISAWVWEPMAMELRCLLALLALSISAACTLFPLAPGAAPLALHPNVS